MYSCILNDFISSYFIFFIFYRAVPPQFRVAPHSMIVDQGATVLMDCAADGEPEPMVSWLKENEEIFIEDRIMLLPSHSLRFVPS